MLLFKPMLLRWVGLAVLGLVTFAHFSFAGSYGEAGCGPGSLIFKKNSFVSQTSALGVNAISTPIHTTAITSNFSNCDAKWGSYDELQKDKFRFIAENYLEIQSDIARGAGETLAAVLYSHGCLDGVSANALKAARPLVLGEFHPQLIAETSVKLSQVCSIGGKS